MKYWRSTFLSAKGDTDICKIPPNSNWPWLFNILLKINYLSLFSLRTSLRCIEGVFEAPSTKLYKRYQYISYSLLLINCINYFLYNPEAVCIKTARSDWNNSKVIRPFCANGQNQNSPKNIKGQFFLSSSFVSRVAPTLPKNSTSNFRDLFFVKRFKKPSTLVKGWWWR